MTGLGPLKIAGDRAELKTWSPRWNGSPFPSPPTAKLQGTLPVPLGCKTNARESAVRKQYQHLYSQSWHQPFDLCIATSLLFLFSPFSIGYELSQKVYYSF